MDRVARYVFVAMVCFGAGVVSGDADMSDLERRLRCIDRERDGLNTDTGRLEKECLKLLEDYTSPEDRGKIYAQIARVYSQSGLTEPDKVISYCQKALEFPLDVTSACKMYSSWASGLAIKHRGKRGEEFAAVRPEIVTPCLRGLKLCLEYDLPAERELPPTVERFHYGGSPDDPTYVELVKKHKEQMAARKKGMLQNDLIMFRDVFLRKIVRFYSRKPLATDELRDLARQILDSEQAVQDLVARVEAKIAKSSKPAQAKNNQE